MNKVFVVFVILGSWQVLSLQTTTLQLATNLYESIQKEVTETNTQLNKLVKELAQVIDDRTTEYGKNTNTTKGSILRKLLSNLQILEVTAFEKGEKAVECLTNAETNLFEISLPNDDDCIISLNKSAYSMFELLDREEATIVSLVDSYEQRLTSCGDNDGCLQAFISFLTPRFHELPQQLLNTFTTVQNHVLDVLIYKLSATCNALGILEVKGDDMLRVIENCISQAE